MSAITILVCGIIGFVTSQAMDMVPRKWAIPVGITGAALALLVGYLLTKVTP